MALSHTLRRKENRWRGKEEGWLGKPETKMKSCQSFSSKFKRKGSISQGCSSLYILLINVPSYRFSLARLTEIEREKQGMEMPSAFFLLNISRGYNKHGLPFYTVKRILNSVSALKSVSRLSFIQRITVILIGME